MKSFLWRMRSNIGWFLAALVVFTVAYLCWAYCNIENCLMYISPVVWSMLVAFAFFFVYAKRYTYDEAFLYGESRREAFGAVTCGATVFALIFSFYVLGLALFVRRSTIPLTGEIAAFDVYNLHWWEILANFMHIFVCNMIAFETANLLRKFKTWKFWLVFAICFLVFVLMGYYLIWMPMNSDGISYEFNYWSGMFSVIIPLIFVMMAADIYMSRGRQYR